jgi:hypothetical protein
VPLRMMALGLDGMEFWRTEMSSIMDEGAELSCAREEKWNLRCYFVSACGLRWGGGA